MQAPRGDTEEPPENVSAAAGSEARSPRRYAGSQDDGPGSLDHAGSRDCAGPLDQAGSRDSRARLASAAWWDAVASVIAGLVPWCWYVWTACSVDYWLDSPEFTAAAVDLDIAHPPGHPLAALWGKLFTLLPVGPLPFRAALAQASACALALVSVQRAVARSCAFVGLRGPAAAFVGVGAAWFLGGSYGFWFQAVRAEVYALQAMLVCFALERLTALSTRAQPDARALYAAALALGLGLANHHFIGVLALPAFAWALVSLTRAQGLRPLSWALLAGLLGLSTYVYLPLRAQSAPPMNLGTPERLDAVAWVVSAQVYAKRIGTEAVQPLGERFADLSVILVENLWAPTLLMMVLGAYLLLRQRRTWPLAFAWIITAAVSLLGRAWLNPVRANPDVLGYMMPGFAAVVALAACGVASLAARFAQSGVRRGVAPALACIMGVLSLRAGSAQASLADFRAPDVFDRLRYRELPQDAGVVLLNPQTVFRHYGAQAVEQVRGDVAMLPIPFLDYGDTGRAIAARHPEFSAIVEGYLAHQRLVPAALDAALARRPLLVELDLSLALPWATRLLPRGLFFEWRKEPPSAAQIVEAARARELTYDALYRALGAQAFEQETKRQLLWLHYTDALYYALHGLHAQARTAASRGLRLEPEARELSALAQALARAEGPLDVRPFLIAP